MSFNSRMMFWAPKLKKISALFWKAPPEVVATTGALTEAVRTTTWQNVLTVNKSAQLGGRHRQRHVHRHAVTTHDVLHEQAPCLAPRKHSYQRNSHACVVLRVTLQQADKGCLEKIKPYSKAEKWEKTSTNSAGWHLGENQIKRGHVFHFEQQLWDAVKLHLSEHEGWKSTQ